MAKAASVTGNTFAETTAVIRRLKDVTYRVARLNEAGWRQNRAGEFFWRLVAAVKVNTMNVSDVELARTMLEAAKAVIDDRLAALEPGDGVERLVPEERAMTDSIGPHLDLRTREGKAWRAAQQVGAGA